MEKYDSSRGCPKCAGEETIDKWHKECWNCEVIWGHFKKQFSGEHIHRKCKRCAFEWAEMPVDGEEEK